MNYSWILFDLDNTLLDFNLAAQYALKKTFLQYEIPFTEQFTQKYIGINKQVWTEFENGTLSAVQLRSERFKRFFNTIKHYHDPHEAGKYYLTHLAETTFVIDNAKSLLEELLPQKKLAIVTNGLKEVQRLRIQKAGLTPYFQTIVVSDEIGVSKPHEAFFDHVFEQMGYPDKKEVLMVGDSISSDIRGGNQYGIDTCWYNPESLHNNSKFQATFEIAELSILKEFI